MDAAHENRRQLGQLMVDEGFLTPSQLQVALAEQTRTERPLGAILVELGFVSAGAVANALAEQHGGLLKTEFGVSAGLYALPGGATRRAAAAAALDPAEARISELETQLQAVLRERNAMAQRLNEQAVRLTEADQAAEAHVAELARVQDQATAHIAGLEAKLQSALEELRAQAEQRQHEQATVGATVGEDELQARLDEAARAQAAEVARVTDAAAAHIAALEAEHRSALTARDELVSELQRELAELRAQVVEPEQPDSEDAGEEATVGRAHLLFVPSASGYALIDFAGPDPPSGTVLDIDGVRYVVRRVGASPFPGGRLRCVFVEPV